LFEDPGAAEEEEEAEEEEAAEAAADAADAAPAVAPVVAENVLGRVEDGAKFAKPEGIGPPAGYSVIDHPIWDAAKRLEAYLMDNTHKEAQENAALESKMILHAFFAVAIHRKTCEGHTWFDKQTKKIGSNTHRAAAVAGSAKETFHKFMAAWGHDIVHHLPPKVLDDICDAIAGTGAAPETKKFVLNMDYMGVNIKDKLVKDVLKVSESATDRWPVGLLGKSAIILGLSAINGMLRAIAQRIVVKGAGTVIQAVDELRTKISAKDASKAMITACRNTLPDLIAFAAGYLSRAGASSVAEKDSIKGVIKTHSDDFAAGESLCTAIMSAPVHKLALSNAVAAQFAAVIGALKTTTIAGYAVADTVKIDEVEVADSEATVAHERMLALLEATK
jgi:hypothetical protein